MDILTIVLPVFLLIALGVFLRSKNIINEHSSDLLNKLAYNLALPALLFGSIVQFRINELFNWQTIAAFYITILVILVVAYFMTLRQPSKTRTAFNMSVIHSNLVYFAFPLILGAYGQLGLAKASIIVAFVSPFANMLSIIILSRNASIKQSSKSQILQVIKDPLFLSCVLGIIVAYFAIILPVAVTSTLGIIGGMALPIALLSIGAKIRLEKIMHSIGLNMQAVLLKLFLMPLICFLLLKYLFDVPALDFKLAILLAAMPVAVSTYVLAHNWNSDSDLVAAEIVLTTLLALITVPLFFVMFP